MLFLPNTENSTIINDNSNSKVTSLMTYLDEARPKSIGKTRSPLLIGLGLGFLGSYLFGEIFNTNNDNDIAILNENLNKHNRLIKITNQRIDILAKNISSAQSKMKEILDKIVQSQVHS